MSAATYVYQVVRVRQAIRLPTSSIDLRILILVHRPLGLGFVITFSCAIVFIALNVDDVCTHALLLSQS